MSDLTPSEADLEQVRARKAAVAPMLDVFRKHPHAEWGTILAGLLAELENDAGTESIEEVFRKRWDFTPSAATMDFWDKQNEIATADLSNMCLTLPEDVFLKLSPERQAELRAKGWPKKKA